ncbi:MAG: putative membrane protein involved in chromosome condensation CrcB-like [Rhodospirillaceae bacterium]|nr:MAG: putative membrane protein involved in chromosome condensation CrcB-like [Rhodospirillaceae bacterium]
MTTILAPKILLAVAGGGALGAMARYVTMSLMGHFAGAAFPWGTLFVNVTGSFLMGALVEFGVTRWAMTPETRAFLVVGVLGGFTTFSTFTLDIVTLMERHVSFGAFLYVLLSVTLGLAAFFAALVVVRFLWPAPGVS